MKKTKKKSNSGGAFALGAAFGAIAGGIAGILTAPKSGKDTRADIKREGTKVVNGAKSQVKKVVKGASTKKTSGKTRK
jgi:gas vesicle protein